MPPEVHPDPLPIIDDNKPHCQASVKAFMAQDTSSSSMLVGLKDSQGGSSKKEDCIIIKQDIPNKMPTGPSTLVISTSGIKDDRQNTPLEDVLVITINDTSLRSDRERRLEFEEAHDIVTFSSSDSFITETHRVITLEVEPTDLGSEPEVTLCHVAVGIREEITTSSTSADVEDIGKGMRNLFSQQEEVMAIQKSTGSGLRSRKGYKFNDDKPASFCCSFTCSPHEARCKF